MIFKGNTIYFYKGEAKENETRKASCNLLKYFVSSIIREFSKSIRLFCQ